MSFSSILKNPATKALLTCPEMLIGLAMLAGIVFGGNELLIKSLSSSSTETDGKITSMKTEVDAKKQFSETLKNLQSSGKEASLSFLTVASPEFLTVRLFEYTQTIKKKVGANLMNLPAPHNQITLLSLEETGKTSSASGQSISSADSATTKEKLDLHDTKNAPFKFSEAATLKDGKLSAYAGNYTLKARGTYAGLLSLLSSLLNSRPVISVNSLNFSLDEEAPHLATLRPGANLIPPPAASVVSTIDGSQGAESGSGGGRSVLTMGTSGASAGMEQPIASQASPTASAVQLPPSAAPVIMTLNFRVYVKEQAESGAGAASSPSPAVASPEGTMPSSGGGTPPAM
ncbi:MAG: hypothetical protein H2174_07090 [Vampirovibrio sp.]|nr:hypothetical protein [Vampirovibrio sp.]